MKGFEYLRNVTTLRLDLDTCTGCGMCEQVCPHQVFVIEQRKARIADSDACMECGACALNCPVKALTVSSGVGCASGMISEWLQTVAPRFAKNGGGCG